MRTTKPLLISYYTNDHQYPQHAERLKKQLTALEIEFYIIELPSDHNRQSNCNKKMQMFKDCMDKFDRPLIWLDIDSEVLKRKEFYEFYNECVEKYDFVGKDKINNPHKILTQEELFKLSQKINWDTRWSATQLFFNNTREGKEFINYCVELFNFEKNYLAIDEQILTVGIREIRKKYPNFRIGSLPPHFKITQKKNWEDPKAVVRYIDVDTMMKWEKDQRYTEKNYLLYATPIPPKTVIIRILGNDLNEIHGGNQTYTNLKFTLEYEDDFSNCDKLYILNRIVNKEKKQQLMELLEKYNIAYLDIPFNKTVFDEVYVEEPNIKDWDKDFDIGTELKSGNNKLEIYNKLKKCNQYLININGARNFALNYGKEKGYEWIFVLDSNSFLNSEDYEEIIKDISPSTEYIAIPQIRVKKNLDAFISHTLDRLGHKEPQIAFKNSSTLNFNEEFAYGVADKCELLRVLNIPGMWDRWTNSKLIYKLDDREKVNVNYEIKGRVIRLSHHTGVYDHGPTNFVNRFKGLHTLIKDIKEGRYD